MYAISGCPRSGTSLMMDIMREVFGIDRIRGKKFPQEDRINKIFNQQEGESDAVFECKKYMFEKQQPHWREELESAKDMNPNGFWEDQYSVSGIRYNFQDSETLKEILTEETKSIYKIVSQGLVNSDPIYIDKIIFMMRHPRSVAKSQERLKRNLKFKTPEGEDIDLGKDLVIHTPEMFNRVTTMACKFLLDNPDIPVHFVEFEELIENPAVVLQGVQDFLGEGDFTKGVKLINPKLRRSYPQEVENSMWGDAEYIYKTFKEGKYQDVVDYMDEDMRATNRQNRNWLCTRTGLITVEGHCKSCKVDPAFRKSLKDHANGQNIDWTSEPCMYECGFDLDSEPITIQESIDNNFWLK